MVANNFNLAVSEIFKHEGGYVDHPKDPGGATNMGITRKTLASWRGIKPFSKLPKSEVKSLKKTEAKAIYKKRYWDRVRGDKLPSGLDLALFDFAVNSGPARAVKTLQALLYVRRDGIIGSITLGALNKKIKRVGITKIILDYSAKRISFLRRLKTFSIFGKGWVRRVNLVEHVALKLVKKPLQNTPISNDKPSKRNIIMNFLSGYKTYIMGAFMLLAALAQIAGVDLPGFDEQSSTELMLQALAFIFLRKGIKGGVVK